MTQDFAKIRPEPILEKKPAQAPPAWSLMVTGILLGITIGVFACVIFYLSGKVPALNVGPSVANSTADLSQVERIEDEYQNSPTVDFEFYTELTQYEVQTNATPVDFEFECNDPSNQLECPVPPESANEPFMLQSGAFAQRELAEQEQQRQLELGLNVIVKTTDLPGRTLFLVQAGPFDTSMELGEAQRLLFDNNITSFRIKLQ